MAITSANATFAADPGLADRLIVVRLDRRTGNTSDSALSEQIAAKRDACLSFIARALSCALGDAGPVPDSLNSRHPDWAAFAVRIGRATEREQETVTALQAGEKDKARFCLENDEVGALIMAAVAEHNLVEGEASELILIVEPDGYGPRKLTTQKLGKRLNDLWPHLEVVYDARQTPLRSRGKSYRLTRRGWSGAVDGEGGEGVLGVLGKVV
jgi:hypothetical protein